MIAWLAVGLMAFHVIALLLPDHGPYPAGLIRFPAGLGLIGSAVLWWFNRQPRGWNIVRFVAVIIIVVWLGTDTYAGVTMHQGVSKWMVLDTILMMLVLFSLLALRQAVIGTLVTYLFFIGAAFLAGEVDPVLLALIAVCGGITAYLTIHGQQISQERLHNAVLRWQVEHDGLTGAVTRQALTEYISPQLGGPHLLLLIDLDHFKNVNDTFGHLVGDEALRHITQVMQAQVRGGDQVARWGGEEFMVFLQNVTPEKGLSIARRIWESVRQSEMPGLPRLTISMGVVSLAGQTDLLSVIATADKRLYTAKARGRDQIVSE